MTTALLDRPAVRPAMPTRPAAHTVADVVAGAWEGLVAHRGVECPLCGGTMKPRYGAAGMTPVGGRCTDCGTTLG